MQNSLFTLEQETDLKKPEPVKKGSKKTTKMLKTKSSIVKREEAAIDLVGNIKMGECIHYTTAGDWSTHDLLKHLLSITGPAKVCICSWSVSESAVIYLLEAIEKGEITNLKLLFDWRVKVRRPKVLQLVKANISNVYLTNTHAKVFTISNENWGISCVGSSNLTNNPRIECGVITADKEIQKFHQSWIEKTIKGSDCFE
jgi:hypothetical protein